MLLISEFAVALLVFPGVVADLEIAADVALLVFPGVVADLEIAAEAVIPDAVLVVMMLLLIFESAPSPSFLRCSKCSFAINRFSVQVSVVPLHQSISFLLPVTSSCSSPSVNQLFLSISQPVVPLHQSTSYTSLSVDLRLFLLSVKCPKMFKSVQNVSQCQEIAKNAPNAPKCPKVSKMSHNGGTRFKKNVERQMLHVTSVS